MHALEASRLVAGDVIFTRDRTSSASWLIRAGTLSDFSHAILYVGHHSFIDSDPHGVHSNNLQRLLFEQTKDVAVKRLAQLAEKEVLKSVCDYARAQIGQQYSRAEAARAAILKTDRIPGERQFCSRLVAQAYASVGILLVKDSNYCTPKEIFNSTLLAPVEDVHRPASSAEMALASDENNPLKRQENITNEFLRAVRQATGSTVGTFEAVVQLVIDRPQFDSAIAILLVDCGYLTMWEWDIASSPHWYDAEIFARSVPLHEQSLLAAEMARAEKEAIVRHESNLANLLAVHAERPLKTLDLLIGLERKLCELCAQRLSVFSGFATD